MYNTRANRGWGGCGRGRGRGPAPANPNPTNLNQGGQNNAGQQPEGEVNLVAIQAEMNELRQRVAQQQQTIDELRNQPEPALGIQGIPNNPLGQVRARVGAELAKDLKNIHLTKFDGNKDAAERWLTELESYFVVRGCSSNAKTTLVGMHLIEIALDWWTTHLTHTRCQAIHIPWEEFVALFKERFLTKQYYVEKQNEFFKLHQGSNLVDQYYHEFIRLLKYLPLYEGNEPMKTQKFILGLDPRIGTIINMHDPDTLLSAYNLAKKAETNQAV